MERYAHRAGQDVCVHRTTELENVKVIYIIPRLQEHCSNNRSPQFAHFRYTGQQFPSLPNTVLFGNDKNSEAGNSCQAYWKKICLRKADPGYHWQIVILLFAVHP